MQRYALLRNAAAGLWAGGVLALVIGVIALAASIPNLGSNGATGAAIGLIFGLLLTTIGSYSMLTAILVSVARLTVDAIYDGIDLIIEATDNAGRPQKEKEIVYDTQSLLASQASTSLTRKYRRRSF